MSGFFGSESAPAAETTTSAVSSPALVRTRQWPASSSQVAASSAVSKAKRSSVPERSATFWM